MTRLSVVIAWTAFSRPVGSQIGQAIHNRCDCSAPRVCRSRMLVPNSEENRGSRPGLSQMMASKTSADVRRPDRFPVVDRNADRGQHLETFSSLSYEDLEQFLMKDIETSE